MKEFHYEPTSVVTNLVVKNEVTEIPEEEIEETEVEFTSRSEYIVAAYNAILAVEDLDTGLMSKEEAKRKLRILRNSVKIIDVLISEMAGELFDDEN